MAASSLKDLDPVEDLLARLRLDRTARRHGVVITEGVTDEAILSSAVGIRRSALFSVGGRNNLLRCVAELEEAKLQGVVCVGDRDFDLDESGFHGMWWFVLYDDADVEAMLVESEALARFLREWAVAEKLEQAGGAAGVRAMLRERVEPVSVLRAVNAEKGMGIRFDAVDLADVFEKKTGTIKVASLVGRLVATTEQDRQVVEAGLTREPKQCPHTGTILARGRDLMDVLAVLLRHVLASLSKQQLKGQFVEKSVRLAVRPGDLDGTPFKARLDQALARAVA